MQGFLSLTPAFGAFAGIKFGGYTLAGLLLRRLQPAITASAAKIAGARTGLGLVLGPLLSISYISLSKWILNNPQSDVSEEWFYPFLFFVRILVWALVIYIFTRSVNLTRFQLWKYATLGALWSCLLDIPGIFMAIVVPGGIRIC